MTFVTSPAGIEHLKRYESCSFVVYDDDGGRATIGYGHLITASEAAAGIFDGGITAMDCDRILANDLSGAERAVNELVRAPITQAQFDALVSLVFNIGEGHFRTSSVLRAVNAGDKAGVRAALALWNKVRDERSGVLIANAGLTKRRAAEAEAFA